MFNTPWFKKRGIVFIPVSTTGWIVTVSATAYAVYAFIDIDSRSHSVSDTLINFACNLVIVMVVFYLIAYLTSRNSDS